MSLYVRGVFRTVLVAPAVAIILGLSLTAPASAQRTWNWGELGYGRIYDTTFDIPSNCPCWVEVSIKSSHTPHPVLGPPLPSRLPRHQDPGNPYLTVPAKVAVPPGGGTVTVQIRTPNPPPIRRVAGVALNDLTLVEGTLYLESRLLPGCCDPNASCNTFSQYAIIGHIHLLPQDGGSGIEPPDCTRFWEEETYPPGSLEELCVETIRALARRYVGTELTPEREGDPDAWSWLPDEAEIGTMATGELIEMKLRAERLRRTKRAASPGETEIRVR